MRIFWSNRTQMLSAVSRLPVARRLARKAAPIRSFIIERAARGRLTDCVCTACCDADTAIRLAPFQHGGRVLAQWNSPTPTPEAEALAEQGRRSSAACSHGPA